MSAAGLRKELDARLSAYMPAVVRRHLERQTPPPCVPDTQQVTAVSMFADVSGFTAMTESLAARGPVGAELLAKHLNSYFEQLLRLVSSAGGDVFKFAGDAILIFWPENKDDTLESLLRRCLQCALRIQEHLHKAELAPGVVLSVKMGVGIGGVTIAHLGGTSDGSVPRVEYVAVGPALQQAFDSEHQAQAGEVICSPECWRMMHKYFDGESVRTGSEFFKVRAVNLPVKLCSRRPSYTCNDATLHARMKQYVSRAVWPYLDAHDEFWGSELRDVTVLFINLGFCEDDLAKMLGISGMQKLQAAFAIVQECIYEYEGTINKFLVDDKGSTVIAAFGLPPVTHENDPVRGILASLAICAALGKLDLKASVGITTGTALCGVVGHQGNRREYTVLGDIVNLSARLMQKAKSENGGVITDETTKLLSHDVLHFEERPEIMVKGKNDSIKIHRPYPRMSILLEFHLSTTSGARKKLVPGSAAQSGGGASRPTQIPNVMENMHRVQVRDAERRLSVRADKEAAAVEQIIESDNFRRVRDALLDKCSELNPFSPGGSFVLEGDIGVGKTVLLRSALIGPESSSYNVLQGTTSPFATRKPYAIWADMISKCALDQANDGGAASAMTTQAPHHGKHHQHHLHHQTPTLAPAADLSKEAERRKQVALFVRKKIKEGAAPNTTLVGYTKLLNAILETDFEEYTREEEANDVRASGVGKSIKLLESDVLGTPPDSHTQVGNNQDAAEQQQQSAAAESPSKSKMKEEEIAAWFLGLLEMDLARSRRNSDDLRTLAPIDNLNADAKNLRSSSLRSLGDGASEAEAAGAEEEWTPTDLDLSGILLLCALHALSRDKSTVFCLDNAMSMDEKSWILATIIAKYFTNCLVVIGTRPPSLALSENTESSSFRKRLRVLKRMRSAVCQSLEPLCGPDLEQLALQTLNVHEIPSELMAILFSRSQGNPLFLRELISEMLQQQVIKVDSKRRTCQMHVQEPWGDKGSASYCFYCYAKYSASKMKHRCKCCGYIFCASCTPKACRKKIPGVRDDLVRHCLGCYTIGSTRRPSSDPSLAATVSAAAAGVSPPQTTFSRPKSLMRSLFHPSSSSSADAAAAKSLKNRIALRPPRTVKSVLTTLLDQLTVSQRMIMKTASVIGAVFDEELLRGSCPILAHLSRFSCDLDELERLAMIRRIDNFVGGVPAAAAAKSPCAESATQQQSPPKLKVKFEFGHGFMQDVIRSQMLCTQLDKLTTRVAEFREQQQKELRQKYFEKANGSLNRQQQPQLALDPRSIERRRGSTPVNAAVPGSLVGGRRALTPTDGRSASRFLSRTHSSGDCGASGDGYSSGTSSSNESSTQLVLDDGAPVLPVPPQVLLTAAAAPTTFVLLKSGSVNVKKRSSVFSHLKLKGLTNARMWKKRFAVLQNARLLLQHDEPSSANNGAGQGRRHHQGTALFLKGAKVSVCDPEVAGKVSCLQVEVNEWAKGKHLHSQRRTVVLDAQSDKEVGDWVFMIRYAIESLENQAAAAAAAAAAAGATSDRALSS